MRSLVVTLNAPTPRNGGAALRNRQTVLALAELGPVDVVSLGVTESEPIEGVEHHEWTFEALHRQRSAGERLRARAWPARPHGHWRLDTYRSTRALRAVERLVAERRPDLVVASQWQTGEYALAAARGRRLVFDTHNVEADLRAALGEGAGRGRAAVVGRIAARRLVGWERRLARAADEVWLCSTDDDVLWRRHHGEVGRRVVVPNTVALPPQEQVASATRTPTLAVLTGTFSYLPNEDAAVELVEEILPRIRHQVPDAGVELVGREPSGRVRALHDPSRRVEVVGAVADVVPRLLGAGVMVVPLRSGGGTRLKILEAMAAGLPVVSTAKGAEGLDAEPGRHLLVADTPADLAAATARVMTDPALASSLGAAGRVLVESRYSSWALRTEVRRAAERLDLDG